MEQALVSIVMVNYNHEDHIAESIESVLAQTYKNWELIIVDDGSVDSSREIIKNYAKKDARICIDLQERNQHICVATNRGFSHVKGEFVARLDSDDVWLPDKLEKQLGYMESHPEGALCFTKLDIIDEEGKVVNESLHTLYEIYNGRQEGKKGWIQHFFFFGNTLIQSTLLMKREVLDTIGGFNLAYVQGHDFDFFVRAVFRYDFIFLEEPLVKYRRMEKQNSTWNEENNRRFFNEHMIIRESFFDEMSDALFREMFCDCFVNPDSATHEELLCEQAFLLCRCVRGEEINPVLGLKKLEKLLRDPAMVKLLEKKFHYTPKDYYAQMLRQLYVTDAIEGELTHLRGLHYMLAQRVHALEQENQQLKEANTQYREKLSYMENSRSWKLTKPLRGRKKN